MKMQFQLGLTILISAFGASVFARDGRPDFGIHLILPETGTTETRYFRQGRITDGNPDVEKSQRAVDNLLRDLKKNPTLANSLKNISIRKGNPHPNDDRTMQIVELINDEKIAISTFDLAYLDKAKEQLIMGLSAGKNKFLPKKVAMDELNKLPHILVLNNALHEKLQKAGVKVCPSQIERTGSDQHHYQLFGFCDKDGKELAGGYHFDWFEEDRNNFEQSIQAQAIIKIGSNAPKE